MPDQSLPRFDVQADSGTVTECAVKCEQIGCSAAAYSDRSDKGNCLLASAGEQRCSRDADQVTLGDAIELPLTIDCVQCNLRNR